MITFLLSISAALIILTSGQSRYVPKIEPILEASSGQTLSDIKKNPILSSLNPITTITKSKINILPEIPDKPPPNGDLTVNLNPLQMGKNYYPDLGEVPAIIDSRKIDEVPGQVVNRVVRPNIDAISDYTADSSKISSESAVGKLINSRVSIVDADNNDVISHALQDAIVVSIQGSRQLMRQGYPELGIPKLDPLEVTFPIRVTQPYLFGSYVIILKNLTFYGFSNFYRESIDTKPFKRQSSFKLTITNVTAVAHFQATANYGLPLEMPMGEGHLVANILGSRIFGRFNMIPRLPDWFSVANLDVKISFDDVRARIYPQFLSSSRFSERIIDGSFRALEAVKPNISELFSYSYFKSVELKHGYIPNLASIPIGMVQNGVSRTLRF